MTMTKLREIEEAMIRHEDPVVSVPELADELGASDTHIRNLLRLLEREGDVASKSVGARATAWWHTERVTPPYAPPADHPDQTALEDQTPRHGPVRDATGDERPWESVDLPDVPGSGDKERDRQEALREALRLLYEAGSDGRASFYAATFDGCETHYSGETSWRKNCAGPAMSELAEQGVVECVDRAEGVWRWVGLEDGGDA